MEGFFILDSNPIYPVTILVSIGQSDLEFKKIREEIGLPYVENIDTLREGHFKEGCTAFLDDGTIIMRLNYFPTESEGFALLQHVVFHIVEYVMAYVGLNLTESSSEAFAYLVQYYTQKIYKPLLEGNIRESNVKVYGDEMSMAMGIGLEE